MKVMISFIVLHYLDGKTTSECIDALLHLDAPENAEHHIIIVDNASRNGSLEDLQARYGSNHRITFLSAEENLGFAKGNNIGYKYARDTLHSDFIITLNNDLLISQRDFTSLILSEYAEKPFAVLGPDIISHRTGNHQNPAHAAPPTEDEIRKRIAEYEDLFSHYLRHKFLHSLKKISHVLLSCPETDGISTMAGESAAFSARPRTDLPAEDVVLHGACLIFSPDFIKKRDHAFNPATFLYFEEDLLALECLQERLLMRYEPSLKTEHLEDMATEATSKGISAREKEMEKNRRLLESYNIYLQELLNTNRS